MTREKKIKVLREFCSTVSREACREGRCLLHENHCCGAFSALPDDAIDLVIRLIGEKKANTDGESGEMTSDEPKTVQQMNDEVCDEICDRYCKWPSIYENENLDEDKLYEEQCDRCPLMRLK